MTTEVEDLNKVVNRKISAASSSLTKLVIVFDDGEGLELEAYGATPAISATIRPAQELQQQTEAVCQVDWSWIISSVIQSITVRPACVVFHLQPGGELSIDARLWQGAAFLSFMPWRPAKKQ